MTTHKWLNPKNGAARTFGDIQRQDQRRSSRAVHVASTWAENPLGFLPVHMQAWKRDQSLFSEASRTRCRRCGLDGAALASVQETRLAISVGLMVQETGDRDRSPQHTIRGVGPIGHERGRGWSVPAVLAMRPQRRALLGCLPPRSNSATSGARETRVKPQSGCASGRDRQRGTREPLSVCRRREVAFFQTWQRSFWDKSPRSGASKSARNRSGLLGIAHGSGWARRTACGSVPLDRVIRDARRRSCAPLGR